MANYNHIEQLLKGVDNWNEWRSGLNSLGEYVIPDFSNVDLWEIFRKAGKLEENSNFPELKAMFIPLSGADFYGADFTNANLGYADLRWTDLIRAKLTGTNLTASEPWKARLGLRLDDIEKVPTHYRIDGTLVKSVQDLLTEIQTIENLHTKDDGEITL